MPHIVTGEDMHLDLSVLRKLLVVTMADIAEQFSGFYDKLFGGLVFEPRIAQVCVR